MPSIVEQRVIDASPEVVFNAIANQDEVINWWANSVVAAPVVGSITEIRFDNGEVMKMEVAEVDPGAKLYWIVRGAPQTYWKDTKITWDVQPIDGGSLLQLGHHGFLDEDIGYQQTRMGWNYFLHSLKSYVETGIGTPYRNE